MLENFKQFVGCVSHEARLRVLLLTVSCSVTLHDIEEAAGLGETKCHL